QAHPGSDPLVSPDRPARRARRPERRRRRRAHPGHGENGRPDRRRDGSPNRRCRRRTGPSRHDQGRRPSREYYRGRGRREDRRQARPLAAPGIRALAITISNRASAGIYPDKSGPVLADLLRAAGCETDGPQVIPDGTAVEIALREAVDAGYDLVVTTGGTGLT